MAITHAFRRKGSSSRGRLLRRAVDAAFMEVLEPRRLLASIVVDTAVDESIADNPTTSLREAFAQASLLGSDDEITFDPEVFEPSTSHTITLLEGAIEVPGGAGQITVHGIGRDKLFISGDGA